MALGRLVKETAVIGVHRRPMILVALVGCSLVQENHIGRR
jgi:hypothetical protein